MMYLKWLLLLPVMIVMTVATFPLAFVFPFFAEWKDGFRNNGNSFGVGWYSPKLLSWFQTPDNPLDGDYGWQTEHWQWRYKLPKSLCVYVGMVGWLWRNPGYGIGCVKMTGDPIEATYTGNKDVNDSPLSEGYILVKSQDLFQLTWCKKITDTKCLYFVFGWNIKGLINANHKSHIATYAFSPRVSSFII